MGLFVSGVEAAVGMGVTFVSLSAKIAVEWLVRYPCDMSTVEELEESVRRLPPEERAAFCAWFPKCDAEEWDQQLEANIAAGRLDWLIAEARKD